MMKLRICQNLLFAQYSIRSSTRPMKNLIGSSWIIFCFKVCLVSKQNWVFILSGECRANWWNWQLFFCYSLEISRFKTQYFKSLLVHQSGKLFNYLQNSLCSPWSIIFWMDKTWRFRQLLFGADPVPTRI